MLTNPITALLDSIPWVYVCTPKQSYWCRTRNLLANSLDIEKFYILSLLKTPTTVVFPNNDIQFQPRIMSATDKQRLKHLLTFERGDFRLSSFQPQSAMFHKDGLEYFSMNEQGEHGVLPAPTISVSNQTCPVHGPNGELLDVFVPPVLAATFFIVPDEEDKTAVAPISSLN